MVDYLKVCKELEDDKVISMIATDLGCLDKLSKGFEALDKILKNSIIVMKVLSDMMGEIEDAIENDKKHKVTSKIKSAQLIMDVLEQFTDSVQKIDGDAVKKRWNWEQ